LTTIVNLNSAFNRQNVTHYY